MNAIEKIAYLILGAGFWLFFNRIFYVKMFRPKITIDATLYSEDKKTKLHFKGEFQGVITNVKTGEIIKPQDK